MCIAYGYFGSAYAPDPDCWKAFPDGFSKKEYEKEPNSEKITYFKRYINNLRFDLNPLLEEEKNKKIRKIKIEKINKVKDSEIDVLIFDLEERDLNLETGRKIIDFLNGLEKRNVKFRIGQKLPPCIFDMQSTKEFKFKTPTNCFECPNNFHIENKRIIFCNDRQGPDLKFMNNKEQIEEYMNLLKEYDKPALFNKCKTCVHKIRGTCFYLKNCRLKPKEPKEEIKQVEITACRC